MSNQSSAWEESELRRGGETLNTTGTTRPTLAAELERTPRLTAAHTAQLITQICESLAQHHANGLVHGHLTPASVVIERDSTGDRARVVDRDRTQGAGSAGFRTASGVIHGTPAYISPEQANHQAPTAASDLYTVGVLAYRCLAGRLPFEADTPAEIVMAHLQAQPTPLAELVPEVPDALDRLVMALLSKEPGDRPRSADHVIDRLSRYHLGVRDVECEPVAPPGAAPQSTDGAAANGQALEAQWSRLETLSPTVDSGRVGAGVADDSDQRLSEELRALRTVPLGSDDFVDAVLASQPLESPRDKPSWLPLAVVGVVAAGLLAALFWISITST